MLYERSSVFEFTSIVRPLEGPGAVTGTKTYLFDFGSDVEKAHESYDGINVRCRRAREPSAAAERGCARGRGDGMVRSGRGGGGGGVWRSRVCTRRRPTRRPWRGRYFLRISIARQYSSNIVHEEPFRVFNYQARPLLHAVPWYAVLSHGMLCSSAVAARGARGVRLA